MDKNRFLIIVDIFYGCNEIFLRGRKHIQDKRKYKGNSTKNPKYVPPKTTSNLGTNWDRYEPEEEMPHGHELSISTNFAMLAETPLSTGNHFQFKSDQIVAQETTSLFNLDLDLLHMSLLANPYYIRSEIDKDYFTEDEIQCMEREAAAAMVDYESFKGKTTLCTSILDKRNKPDTTPKMTLLGDEKGSSKEPNNKDIVKKTPVNDLEQWLDDILDD